MSVWSVQLIQLARSYGALPYPQAPACCLTFLEDLPWGNQYPGALAPAHSGANLIAVHLLSRLILGATEKLGKRG